MGLVPKLELLVRREKAAHPRTQCSAPTDERAEQEIRKFQYQ